MKGTPYPITKEGAAMSENPESKVKAAAAELAKHLREYHFYEKLIVRVGKPEPTETDGFAIKLASFGGGQLTLQVWYDQWPDGKEYKYWVGFGSDNPDKIQELISSVSEYNDTMPAIIEVANDISVITKHKNSLFYEPYGAFNWFGIYLRPFNLQDVTNGLAFIKAVLRVRAYHEGPCSQVTANRYERDRKARERCIHHFGCRCSVCGMSFEKRYGNRGKDFIHVHHIESLHSKGKSQPDPARDLRPVCPNCHAMLHTENPPLAVEELCRIWKEQRRRL
jgi:predicted HNH restriction endonuclease